MNKLEKFVSHLKQFTPEKQEQDMFNIVLSHEAEIVDMNIGQMMDGRNADGSSIQPAYAPLTVEIKKAKGQVFDKVTLRDEGLFHQGTYLEKQGFPTEVNSTDKKTGKLDEKYDGEKFFGISEDNKKIITKEVIKDDTVEYYKGVYNV